MSRTVVREAIATARCRWAGRTAPGRRRVRQRTPRPPAARCLVPRSARRSAWRSTSSKCAWASRSRAPRLRRAAQRRRRTPRSRRPSSSSTGCSPRRGDGHARLRVPSRDRRRHQQSVLRRSARCARHAHHPLRRHLALGHRQRAAREYQQGLQARASRLLQAISAGDPERRARRCAAHLSASQARYRGLLRTGSDPQWSFGKDRDDAWTPAGPSILTAARLWTAGLRSAFLIETLFDPGKIHLTYTHSTE